MTPIFYVATGCWMVLTLLVVIAVGRREDRLEDQRRDVIYQQIRQIGRVHLAQLAELSAIDDITTLEAFRIKEGLS